jgi:phage N-6-adenine-methyltransferase
VSAAVLGRADPRLAELVADIRAAHRACGTATRAAVGHARDAGRLLLEAKALVPHGGWGAWVRAHAGCSERTAQLYMQLARAWPALAGDPQRVADLALRDAARALAEARSGEADGHVSAPDATSDEWYSPAPYVEAARRLLGGIDLDPASCAAAQAVVRAGAWYGKADDGLGRPWRGRVWLNPPYSAAGRFAAKLAAEHEAGRVAAAVALVNASTDAAWFAALAGRYPVLFTRGRVRFWRPDRGGEAPPSGQALFGVGVAPGAFAAAFASLAYAPNAGLGGGSAS